MIQNNLFKKITCNLYVTFYEKEKKYIYIYMLLFLN